MTRQVIAHTDLYNDLCVFISARRRTRKRAHPHANSTTSGRRGRKMYTLRVSLYH